MSRLLSSGMVLVLGLALVAPAGAHSLLLASSPVAGSTVGGEAGRLTLRFNNRIEKRLSRVRLVDVRGEKRTLVVTADDRPVEELHASLPALGPGHYRVEWQVLSTDGHVVNGVFSFRVGAGDGGTDALVKPPSGTAAAPARPALETR